MNIFNLFFLHPDKEEHWGTYSTLDKALERANGVTIHMPHYMFTITEETVDKEPKEVVRRWYSAVGAVREYTPH